MTRKNIVLSCTAMGAVVCLAVLAPAFAQIRDLIKPKEVTVTGRVVDLHCLMTGTWMSADHAKCTADCIRAGVPAALETKDGIYVLGTFNRNVSEALLPFAFKMTEVSGNVYEKHNIRYLDFKTIKEANEIKSMDRPLDVE